jgi:hypothetical protein
MAAIVLMTNVRTVSAAAGTPSVSTGHQPKAKPCTHRHQQSYQRQDCGVDLPRGDVRQRVLEARQDFAQAGAWPPANLRELRHAKFQGICRRQIRGARVGIYSPCHLAAAEHGEPCGQPIGESATGELNSFWSVAATLAGIEPFGAVSYAPNPADTAVSPVARKRSFAWACTQPQWQPTHHPD